MNRDAYRVAHFVATGGAPRDALATARFLAEALLDGDGLDTFAHNLAIGGALCGAYELGAERYGGFGFYPGHLLDELRLLRGAGLIE